MFSPSSEFQLFLYETLLSVAEFGRKLQAEWEVDEVHPTVNVAFLREFHNECTIRCASPSAGPIESIGCPSSEQLQLKTEKKSLKAYDIMGEILTSWQLRPRSLKGQRSLSLESRLIFDFYVSFAMIPLERLFKLSPRLHYLHCVDPVLLFGQQ